MWISFCKMAQNLYEPVDSLSGCTCENHRWSAWENSILGPICTGSIASDLGPRTLLYKSNSSGFCKKADRSPAVRHGVSFFGSVFPPVTRKILYYSVYCCAFGFWLLSFLFLTYNTHIMRHTQSMILLNLILDHLQDFRDGAGEPSKARGRSHTNRSKHVGGNGKGSN